MNGPCFTLSPVTSKAEIQLRTADRLLNLFGILGVIATQLLQLRDVSRIKPEDPAEQNVDPLSVEVTRRELSFKG